MNDANFLKNKQYARYWIDVDTVYGVILRVKKQDWSIGTPDTETGKFLVTSPGKPVDEITQFNLEYRDERALLRMFPNGFYLFDPSNKNYDKFNVFYRIKGHEMEDQVIGENWKANLDNTRDVWKSLVCKNEKVMPDGTKLKVNEKYLGCNTYNIDLENNSATKDRPGLQEKYKIHTKMFYADPSFKTPLETYEYQDKDGITHEGVKYPFIIDSKTGEIGYRDKNGKIFLVLLQLAPATPVGANAPANAPAPVASNAGSSVASNAPVDTTNASVTPVATPSCYCHYY